MITLINTPWFTLSLKHPSGWCLWHYSNEEGLACVQVGPWIAEVIA